jgi:hypothetical protein
MAGMQIDQKRHCEIERSVPLASRAGDGFVALFMLFMPLAIVLLMLAMNGMALASGYKQAHNLAQLAALSGAGSVVFDGARPQIDTSRACARVAEALTLNGARTLAGFKHSCRASARRVTVRLVSTPVLVMPDTFGIFPDQIAVEAHSAPVFGINEAEET